MSEGKDDGQEKTEDPTPRKLEKAREKGDIPRSTDVSAAASYLTLLLLLVLCAGWSAQRIGGSLVVFLGSPDKLSGLLLGPGGPELAFRALSGAMLGAAPILLGIPAAVIAVLIAQQAIVVSGDKLQPKLSKISPLSNAKQKYGIKGLVEFAKSATKLLAVSIVLVMMVIGQQDDLIGYAQLHATSLPVLMRDQGARFLTWVTVLSIAIASADYFWQRFQHIKKLRMSHQEMKEEMKESEGDPHFKAARRERGREIAMNQMMMEVPRADVVMVNPTHYAVALQWSRKPDSAPTVVAKGVDAIAAAIREAAEKNDVPVHSDPPSTRALYAATEIGDEVEPEHYAAVAAAIRFADAARVRARARGY